LFRSKKLIESGDAESNYAYYCLHKLRIRPREFLEMDRKEKAFIIASIRIKQESEDKKRKEMERKNRRRR